MGKLTKRAPSSDEVAISKHELLLTGLSQRISKMKAHDRLSSERQLAEEFQVSRMTLRRALEVLQVKGLIYTKPSSGMYVAEAKLVRTSDVTSLSEVTRHRGAHPRSTIHLADKVKASVDVAQALEVEVDHPVYRIEQTFYDNETPLATETSYVNAELARGLLDLDLTQSLSLILKESFENPIVRVRYRVRAVIPPERFLNRLNVSDHSPVLEFCARGVTKRDRVIFYVVSFKRGDKYDLAYEIEVEEP